MKSILCLLILILPFHMAIAQTIIKLYPDKIPNSIPSPDFERIDDDGIIRISKISRPTLTIYLPIENATGTAVVVVPGGGYEVNAFKHEGTDMAMELNRRGIAAFVLKYRLPSDQTMTDKSIGPLQDAQQAIRIVRQRAKEWNIDPNKIGIAGFSAGGHLASTAGTHFQKALIDNPDNISLRPDFMILLYPVISFTDSIAHIGSRNNLIGESPKEDIKTLYSNELQITPQTPPTFLMHATDDDVVKIANSIQFQKALQTNKVPAELFIYPKGGHGFGLNNPTSSEKWLDKCVAWMKKNKLTK